MKKGALLLAVLWCLRGFAQLVNNDSVIPPVATAKPAYNALTSDAVYDSRLVRIAADPGIASVGRDVFGNDSRHHFTTDQPWSRTGAYFLLQNGRGQGHCSITKANCLAACPTLPPPDGRTQTCLDRPPPCLGVCENLVLNGTTYAPIANVHARIAFSDGTSAGYRDADSWWSLLPGEESIRVAISNVRGKVGLFKYDALTSKMLIDDPPSFWASTFTGGLALSDSQGQSWDGTIHVAIKADHKKIQLIKAIPGGIVGPEFDVYTQAQGIASALCHPSPPETGCRITQAQVSPSGEYVVLNYPGDVTRVLAVDPTDLSLRELDYRVAPAIPGLKALPGCFMENSQAGLAHGFITDLGHKSVGRNPVTQHDVVVGVNACAGLAGTSPAGHPSLVDVGYIVMQDLTLGRVTSLTHSTTQSPEAVAMHTSCLAYEAPGWVVATYYPWTAGAHRKYEGEVVRIKMDGGTIERYGLTHTEGHTLTRCEPHAVERPSGGAIAVASCWTNNCGTDPPPWPDSCDPTSSLTNVPGCGPCNWTQRQDYIFTPKRHLEAEPVTER